MRKKKLKHNHTQVRIRILKSRCCLSVCVLFIQRVGFKNYSKKKKYVSVWIVCFCLKLSTRKGVRVTLRRMSFATGAAAGAVLVVMVVSRRRWRMRMSGMRMMGRSRTARWHHVRVVIVLGSTIGVVALHARVMINRHRVPSAVHMWRHAIVASASAGAWWWAAHGVRWWSGTCVRRRVGRVASRRASIVGVKVIASVAFSTLWFRLFRHDRQCSTCFRN